MSSRKHILLHSNPLSRTTGVIDGILKYGSDHSEDLKYVINGNNGFSKLNQDVLLFSPYFLNISLGVLNSLPNSMQM